MDNIKFDTSDFEKLLKKFKRLRAQFPGKELMGQLASNARNIIYQRTGRGIDVRFQSFPAYSTTPYYRPKKERPIGKGGRRKSKITGKQMATIFYEGGYKEFASATKGNSNVTLMATNEMFRSFQAKLVTSDMAIVGFNRALQVKKALTLTARKGKFVGLHKKEKEILESRASRILNQLLKKVDLK